MRIVLLFVLGYLIIGLIKGLYTVNFAKKNQEAAMAFNKLALYDKYGEDSLEAMNMMEDIISNCVDDTKWQYAFVILSEMLVWPYSYYLGYKMLRLIRNEQNKDNND